MTTKDYTVTVSDGAGGDDSFSFRGTSAAALAFGERKAQRIRYDFGDDDYGDLDVEVFDEDDNVVAETTVRRYRA